MHDCVFARRRRPFRHLAKKTKVQKIAKKVLVSFFPLSATHTGAKCTVTGAMFQFAECV
jgi:hypothetical protein